MHIKLDLKQIFLCLFLYLLVLFPGAVNSHNVGLGLNLFIQIFQFSLVFLFYKKFNSQILSISIDRKIIVLFFISTLLIVITNWDELMRSLNSDEIFYARIVNQQALLGLEKINFKGNPKIIMLIISFLISVSYLVVFKLCYKKSYFFLTLLLICLTVRIIISNLFSFSLLHQTGWVLITSLSQIIFLGENISYRIDKVILFLLGFYFIVTTFTQRNSMKPFLFLILSVLAFHHPLIKYSVLINEPSVFTFMIICAVFAAEKTEIDLNNLILIILCGFCLRLNCIFILPIVFIRIMRNKERIPYGYLFLALAVIMPRFIEVYFLTNVKNSSGLVTNFEPAIISIYNNLGIFGIATMLIAFFIIIRNKKYGLLIIPIIFLAITFSLSDKLIIVPRYIFEFSVPLIILGVIVLCSFRTKYQLTNYFTLLSLTISAYIEVYDFKANMPVFNSDYLKNRENYATQRFLSREPYEYDIPLNKAAKTPLIVGYDYGGFSLILNDLSFEKYLKTKEHFNQINQIDKNGGMEELIEYINKKKDFSIIVAEIGGHNLAEALELNNWKIKEILTTENWRTKTYLLEYE